MNWQTILKARQTSLDEFDQKPPSKGPRQTQLGEFTSRRTIPPSSRKTTGPKVDLREEDFATGDDTKSNIQDIKARLSRDSRGQYGKLADAVTLLATRAREEPREQKRLLGRIRRMIRKKNIQEAK